MDPTKRVIYGKNPLQEVTLQVKFPPILSIDAKEPADFQEAIRQEYPNYQVSMQNENEITISAGGDVPFAPVVRQQRHKNHNFISEDGKYKVSLTSSIMTLSTLEYTRWENMLAHLKKPFQQLLDVYQPSFFERISLQYIDVFSRAELGLAHTPWRELIQPAWLGALCDSGIQEGRIKSSGTSVEYMLSEESCLARIRSRLGRTASGSELVFLLDNSFIYTQKSAVDQFYSIANYLHEEAGLFIRAAITETLHNAMEPGDPL